ncbi:YeeE/YedE family protein [Acidisoma sp. C75]
MALLIYAQSFAGGLLIGTAAALFLVLNGRIAGISGLLGGLLGRWGREAVSSLLFLVGLLLGPLLYRVITGHLPMVRIEAGWLVVIAGGLLVGFGTRLGTGCTSGHGVCGLARLSPRSLVAVGVFMAAAVATVFVTHHLLGGQP